MNYPGACKTTFNKIIKYGNRGMDLETLINETNNYYLEKDIAVIYKKPTPIGIAKVSYENKERKIVKSYFKEQSTLDYNGLYEYLYRMKYGERYEFSGNSSGIPAEEFENLIMEFLPITAEQIKKWAVFDSEHQTYDWERLGCLNYSPTHFGTSLPEVVEIRDSGEGNSVLVVDAVCDTFICNDAVITSELTVKFNDDKSFKYMGNKILNNGTKEVPKYQYRIKRKN